MKYSKLSVAALICVALIGCGGGGDDGGGSPAPSTTVVTRSDIETFFRVGVQSSDLISLYEQDKLPFFAGFLIGVSNTTGGSTSPASIACTAGGNVTANITKTGVYQGLNANDSATLSFNNCSFTGQPTTYNGSAVVTSLNGARGLDNTGVNATNLQFRLASTNLSLARGSLRVVHNGSVNTTYNSSASSLSFDVTALTAHSYAAFSPATASTASFTTTASTGSRVVSTSSNAMLSLGYTGRTTASTSSGSVVIDISTPTTITGTRNASSGLLVPVAGVMNVTETIIPVATRGTFSPRSLTISGDTDRNGTLDLTFATIF
jgi:hypothetical protein